MVSIEYCEKTILSGYLEPVNFISNLAIIAAGFFILRYIRKNKIKDTRSKIFLALVFLTGIGSMSWHLTQTAPTLALDMLPILIIIVITLYSLIYQITKDKAKAAMIVGAAFILIPAFEAISNAAFNIKDTNGPPFAGIVPSLAGILTFIFIKNKKIFNNIATAAGFFAAALFFRQIDLIACATINSGTHWIWHILNSYAVYYMFLATYKR